MLPVSFRLSKKKDIENIFRLGNFSASDAFLIKWKPTQMTRSRVGFIASKKIFPKAALRNRAKRIARESIRPILFQLRPGFDIIVMYRHKPNLFSYAESVKHIRYILKKNNLLK